MMIIKMIRRQDDNINDDENGDEDVDANDVEDRDDNDDNNDVG